MLSTCTRFNTGRHNTEVPASDTIWKWKTKTIESKINKITT